MLTKKILKFLLLVSINFCFIPNSFATDPYLFVQETADEASEALNKRLSKEEKMEQLKIIAKKNQDGRTKQDGHRQKNIKLQT